MKLYAHTTGCYTKNLMPLARGGSIGVHRELSLAIENDVFINLDIVLGHYGLRSIAVEREGPTALRNSSADARFAAWANHVDAGNARATASTASTVATHAAVACASRAAVSPVACRLTAPNQRNCAHRADTQRSE
jgi:hypothetical protein